MKRKFFKKIRNLWQKKPGAMIEPDEIFLDSSNLPAFDRSQFEGRIEKPIVKSTMWKLGAFFMLIFVVLIFKVWVLQYEEGEAYAIQSQLNRLRNNPIFSERGIIYDRSGIELAWNVPNEGEPFSRRQYIHESGFSHVLGYVSYPLRDSSGNYYQKEFIGIEGVEDSYDDTLKGKNGLKIIETDAFGDVQSESVVEPPEDGKSITLSIDSKLQHELFTIIADIAESSGFDGGSGAIMDVNTGEILALTNYPEYDSNVLADGGPADTIDGYVKNTRTPFLNRAVSGLYTPGSIVKPFIALGALKEGVISPEKQILSTGELVLENPYDPDHPSIFRDWRPQGYVDMRHAIAVSSDVYFYEVGGGYEDQPGLGIENLKKYMELFGVSKKTGIDLPSEAEGVIPDPAWKKENFGNDPWRVGDTYLTSIGQYGFQVTPIQMLRAVAAIASDGILREPHVLSGKVSAPVTLPIDRSDFDIVKEGMRYAVTKQGTAEGLWFPDISIAAKTGTAEIGAGKSSRNSWTTGFFPYAHPKYAFVVVMDHAPAGTIIGSVEAARRLFEWMKVNTPEYLSN